MTAPRRVRRVETLELPELEPYRTLRRPESHLSRGIFVAEGEKVVRRLLESEIEVVSFLLEPSWFDRLFAGNCGRDLSEAEAFLGDRRLLSAIVGFNLHQGVMALAKVPAQPSLDELPSPHLLVALDQLRVSENVGVIVRNAAAFGADAILAGERSASPWLRRAVRNSMGAVFGMPVLQVERLAGALEHLRRRSGTRIVAGDPNASATIQSTPLTGNLCIVLGNEETGISEPVRTLADARVAIPMQRRTDSLNVAVAAAVFLYEADRQRRAGA